MGETMTMAGTLHAAPTTGQPVLEAQVSSILLLGELTEKMTQNILMKNMSEVYYVDVKISSEALVKQNLK